MQTSISAGRYRKGEHRDTPNWCEKLELKATIDGDQFIMAAVARAIIGYDDSPAVKDLLKAIGKVACECRDDHEKSARPAKKRLAKA